jgi:galactose mutarotase-like enzyme
MLTLANDHASLTLAPEYGARVTGLTDLATGRQWLVPGDLTSGTGADAIYGADAARGWDECFPTVGVCDHPAWGGRMRDHGLLWGMPWDVTEVAPDHIQSRYSGAGFAFKRSLTLAASTVTADYAVANLSEAAFPYLWSQHCLLATTPLDRIVLSGQTGMSAGGIAFEWPRHPLRDLAQVGPITEGFALKSYAATPGRASAAIVGPNGGIRFDWSDIPALGLWLSYGGWPVGGPVHQLALEPTSATADHLAQAQALGQTRILAPQETHRWRVRITLTSPETRNLP